MSDPSIRDIPAIKKMLSDAKSMQAFKAISPLIVPLLRLVGTDVKEMQEALGAVNSLRLTAEELAAIPDRFNDLFGKRGWIMYDLMNLDVAKAAIAKAESGDLEGAETDLVNYYSADNVEWLLRTMMGVKAFRARMPLAEKAFDDYKEQRYHACVPLVLILLDGLVNAIHQKRRGFFAEDVDLRAWNSIAAHGKGLNALVKLFQTGRYTTTTEPLTIPYRNGILHGMDLGYDNRVVAAKCWAALFATRDWAMRAEQGLIDAPPEKPEKSWREVLHQIKENQEDKKRLEAWRPRSLVVGADLPATGLPTEFKEQSPERTVVEFLTYWKARNYGRMAEYRLSMLKAPIKKMAGEVRDIYDSTRLDEFEIEQSEDESPAVTNVDVRLRYFENETWVDRVVSIRVLAEDEGGNPTARGKPGARWRITNWGLV